MLINFRVANFRAFRDPQELTLRRARGLESGGSAAGWDVEISPVAVVYGPNASGKSTLVKAMAFVGRAARDSYRSWPVDGGVPGVTAFALDSESAEAPSEFEIEFVADDGVRYQYGFQASEEKIESEWLYAYRSANRSIIFERGLSDGLPVRFGNSFRGNRVAITDALEQRPNALFLSVAAQLGNEFILAAHRWVATRFRVYNARGYRSEHRRLARLLQRDDSVRRQLAEVLSQADIGVADVTVAEHEVDTEMLERAYRAARILSDDGSLLDDEEGKAAFIESNEKGIQFLHRTSGEDVPFPLEWESDGTQALISFASVAMQALRTGSTMVVDEIDTSLHPLIVTELVRVFRDSRTNPRQAQLIVTTHDVSLLDADVDGERLLDRDQVWVTEKSLDGSSALVSIGTYRTPRKSENLMRGYLAGRYGGVPMPSIFEAICDLETV